MITAMQPPRPSLRKRCAISRPCCASPPSTNPSDSCRHASAHYFLRSAMPPRLCAGARGRARLPPCGTVVAQACLNPQQLLLRLPNNRTRFEIAAASNVSLGGRSAHACSCAVRRSAQCRRRCSAVQCSAVQCSAVQCNAVQCSAVWCNAVQCSAVQACANVISQRYGSRPAGASVPAHEEGQRKLRIGGTGRASVAWRAPRMLPVLPLPGRRKEERGLPTPRRTGSPKLHRVRPKPLV